MARRWCIVALFLLALVTAGCEPRAGARPRPTDTPAPGTLPTSMAALGDSLTTAFGSCLFLDSCTRNSWSTGNGLRIDSHFQRIVEGNPALRGNAHNLAVPRARAVDLAAQARAAVSARVEYVTVLVGANDICRSTVDNMTGAAAFRREVGRALDIVKRGLPRTRVLVASVPDLYRLWEIGHGNPRVVRMWSRGVCPPLLANATSGAAADAARRAAVRERVTAYNGELAAACRSYGARCRYDGGAVHRVRFTLGMLNVLYYFHPSVVGQNKLAEVTYPGQFSW